jgi:opacity protein-like surface antigen
MVIKFNEGMQMKLKTINVISLSLISSAVLAGTMGPIDNFKPSLYFKVGSGGSYSMSAGINNPNPTYWDASPQGYNGDVGQSALYSAAIGYSYSKLISTDFEYIYRPSFNYIKYQTSTASQTIAFNGNKTRIFNLQSNSLMWNVYLHGKGYSDDLNYNVYDDIFMEPFVGGGLGVAFNTVSNFHSNRVDATVASIMNDNYKTSIAWQFSAGLNFYNTSNFNLGAGYRYYNGEGFASNSYIVNNQTIAPPWLGIIQANEFFVQLGYKIDS